MYSIDELDEYTQKAFKRITAKQPQELNEGEQAFVKARRDYLGMDLEKKFADILEEKKETTKKAKK